MDTLHETPTALDNVTMVFIRDDTVVVYDDDNSYKYILRGVENLTPFEDKITLAEIQISAEGVWLFFPYPVAMELNGRANLVIIDEEDM